MINLDEVDPQKARSGLFALITARLEDAYEFAVRGQSPEVDRIEYLALFDELTYQYNQIEILIIALGAIQD